MSPRCLLLICCLILVNACFGQNKILIAAASDLKFALDSVIIAFKKNNEGQVDATYGSSGKFHEQILHGAPFDIYFSADISYPSKLKEANVTASEVYPYAKGRLVLWSKTMDPTKKGMLSLNDPTLQKVAIGNPMHAPYGKRAMESIAFYKLSAVVRDKLVYGENITQTAQFVSTGAADIGIIALSLALSPNLQKEKGHYYIIPEESHRPLIQGAVITSHGKGNKYAEAFFAFVKEAQAVAILKHYGFTQP